MLKALTVAVKSLWVCGHVWICMQVWSHLSSGLCVCVQGLGWAGLPNSYCQQRRESSLQGRAASNHGLQSNTCHWGWIHHHSPALSAQLNPAASMMTLRAKNCSQNNVQVEYEILALTLWWDKENHLKIRCSEIKRHCESLQGSENLVSLAHCNLLNR